MQERKMICYESRKINEHEKKCVTHDLEVAVIMHALNMWRHYLLGRSFILMTYHYGLKYLFEHPILNARHARWMALISDFDFEIIHIKEKENRVVDVLDRIVWNIHLVATSVGESNI